MLIAKHYLKTWFTIDTISCLASLLDIGSTLDWCDAIRRRRAIAPLPRRCRVVAAPLLCWCCAVVVPSRRMPFAICQSAIAPPRRARCPAAPLRRPPSASTPPPAPPAPTLPPPAHATPARRFGDGNEQILAALRLVRLIKLVRLAKLARLLKRWEAKVAISYATISLTKVG